MEGNEYFRVEMIALSISEKLLTESDGYLSSCNEELITKYRISCGLHMLEGAYLEELNDEIALKARRLGLLDCNPTQIRLSNGVNRTLAHSYNEVTRMIDDLASVNHRNLGRTSYNLNTKRYGIKR